MNEKRNISCIASDIEDVLVGLERAEKAVYKIFENYYDDINGLIPNPNIFSRLDDYETALMLSMDRIFDERTKLEKLTAELYEFHRNLKRKEATA